MKMRPILSALLLAVALPALAQDAAAPAEGAAPAAPAEGAAAAPAAGTELSSGEPAIGSTYVAAEFDAWQQRCVRAENGADPCQLYQLLRDGEGTAVMELTLFNVPAGGEVTAGATVIAPLETLLPQQITLQIDAQPAKKYPFVWCSPIGCVARLGFSAAEVEQMKAGAAIRMTIVPVMAPDRPVEVQASLRGFTRGFEAVTAANDAAAAAAGAAAPAEGGN